MNSSSCKPCLSPAVKCFYDVALLDTENDVDIDTIDEDLSINFDQIIERVYSRDDTSDAEAVLTVIPLTGTVQQ